jgi:phosphopantetheinyl transferase
MWRMHTACLHATLDALDAEMPSQESDWLTPGERRELRGMRHAGQRRQWLAGRWLSKQLIADRLDGDLRDWQGIEIHSRDGQGRSVRPEIFLAGRAQSWPLSISHAGGAAAAALGDGSQRQVGVDLVECIDRGEGFLRMWFTPDEQSWVRRNGWTEACKIWAAKEAAYKALNRGEPFRPQRVEICPRPCGPYGCAGGGESEDDCRIHIEFVGRNVMAVAEIRASGARLPAHMEQSFARSWR